MASSTLFIFCGKMASGKTTLAKKISEEISSVLVSEDVLLGKLYPGEITDVPSYIRMSGNLKTAMKPLLINMLRNECAVVLDFPANTINQRKWIKEIVDESSALHEFRYLDCSDAQCKNQLSERAIQEPDRQATDTEKMFDAISKYFEPPTIDEGFKILIHKR